MDFEPAHDTLVNVVNQQIKRGIRVCLAESCFGSAVILIYSGIDAMAYVSLPADDENVTRSDFIAWADRYISLCSGKLITGEELYSARCSMVHTYGVASDLTRKGRCRQIGDVDNMEPPIRFNAAVSTELVLVSIKSLAEAFFAGVDRFMIDVFSDGRRAPNAERRLESLCKLYRLGQQ